MPAAGRGVSAWLPRLPAPARILPGGPKALVPRPREIGTNRSQVELAGGAVADQPGALDVAAHGAQVAMAGVAHDVLVTHALVVGFGDKADAQGMRAQPVEPVHRQPGHLHAMRQDSPDRLRMQGGVAGPL